VKVLHTSDWHLGRTLYGRRRYREFEAFLQWLLETLESEKIDLLLIAGDIFDTTTPGNRAQELYYRFLTETARTCCRHVVIIGGNHDSPSFLDAPAGLLKVLNVHMRGARKENPADEVIELLDKDGKTEALVCAVPYLRDRDIRQSEAGESIEEKQQLLLEGMARHYREVCQAAEERRKSLNRSIPLIAMGHLFTAGGKTAEDDGVRDLYIGSLGHFSAEHFPDSIDYLALGHLHIPQKVAGREHFRYSGSPIPMGFGEAEQQKSVVLIDFPQEDQPDLFASEPVIGQLEIPCFQPLKSLKGSLNEIEQSLSVLKKEQSQAWLEIELTQPLQDESLREQMDELLSDSQMEIRRLRNRPLINRVLHPQDTREELEDLDPQTVFRRCLDSHELDEQEGQELMAAHQEILKELQEQDLLSEEETEL